MTDLERNSSGESSAIRVLVVDDDGVLVRALQRVLGAQGFEVDTALDGRSALRLLEGDDYDVMLLDLRLGSSDGLELFAQIQQRPPATIIHSAHIDVRTAVLATRAGVQDVMQKPVPEEALTARIRELAAQRRAQRKGSGSIPAPAASNESLLRFVGSSAPAVELRENIRRVAQFRDVPVLVQGATGTGKELVAQAIHALTCPDEPFVSLNCAAVPEQLFESELFGHEAGAFTNARALRIGLFEEAGRGTLFLDEVGEMPLALQAKLLRVLEIRQFRRVGGTRTRMLSARIVSATNRALSAGIGSTMRQDLYFRLAGYAIRTPSLIERISDVPELARHFLYEFRKRHRLGSIALSADALEALSVHPWPGNVRELRAVIENASIVARAGVITRVDIETSLLARVGFATQDPESGTQPVAAAYGEHPSKSGEVVALNTNGGPRLARRPGSLPDIQRDMILRVFEESQQNLSKAASELGIPRSTLRARLKRYGAR